MGGGGEGFWCYGGAFLVLKVGLEPKESDPGSGQSQEFP